MSADQSAPALRQQLSDAFAAYRRSVGDYHQASRGADSARAAGVIKDSYAALVRLAVRAGLPTMPPRPVVPGYQGDWLGWGEWLQAIDHWWVEAEAWLDEGGKGASDQAWFTVTQAAKAAGCNSGEISRAVGAGLLTSNGKTGRARRIEPDSLSRWQLRRAERVEPTESDSAVERKLRQAGGK
jgi:hypothetical protein